MYQRWSSTYAGANQANDATQHTTNLHGSATLLPTLRCYLVCINPFITDSGHSMHDMVSRRVQAAACTSGGPCSKAGGGTPQQRWRQLLMTWVRRRPARLHTGSPSSAATAAARSSTAGPQDADQRQAAPTADRRGTDDKSHAPSVPAAGPAPQPAGTPPQLPAEGTQAAAC
jgi:hypothetical protein